MRIVLHITNRVLYTWPALYWSELIKRLVDDDHDIFIFTDDKQVNIDIEHIKVRKCYGYDENEIDQVIRQCDVFIGVPLRFSEIAKNHRLKIINILGSTLKGEGIQSRIICAGCIDKNGLGTDCIFQDELCYWEITPTDVKRELDIYANHSSGSGQSRMHRI